MSGPRPRSHGSSDAGGSPPSPHAVGGPLLGGVVVGLGEDEPLLGEPLLGGQRRASAGSGMARGVTPDAWRKEVSKVARLAGPMALMNFLQFAQSVIAVGVVGRLGALQLSVVILGNSIFNISGFSVMCGLSSAMETLCGQEFGSAGNSHVMDVILLRATMILMIACLPIFVLWWYLEPALLLVGQDPELSRLSAEYVWLLAPALPAVAICENVKRYLQSQNIVKPSMWISVVSVLHVPPLQWAFVHRWGLGVNGAAYALALTNAVTAAMFVAYVIVAGRGCRPGERPWSGWSSAALTGWGEYLRIAFPSAAMMCLEWWAFEIVIFMGGRLPNPDLEVATMGVGFNTIAIAFMLPFGISQAASVRTSNELGAGNAAAAQLAAVVTLAAGAVVALVFASSLYFLRFRWAALFTSDAVLVDHCQRVLRVVALCCVFDGMNAVCCGVIRGCGRQQVGGAVISVHYLVGLPLGALFGFGWDMGVVGLWAGLTTATALETIGLGLAIGTTDWDKEVGRAAQSVLKTEEGVAAEEVHHALLLAGASLPAAGAGAGAGQGGGSEAGGHPPGVL